MGVKKPTQGGLVFGLPAAGNIASRREDLDHLLSDVPKQKAGDPFG